MKMKPGAHPTKSGECEFVVWAPLADDVAVRLVSPQEDLISMTRDRVGYWRTKTMGVGPGAEYFYRINKSEERPDPASHFQPRGVHGPSAVVAHDHFPWSDQSWKGVSQEQLVIYEAHVGAYTSEGTFDSIIPRLPELRSFGITAVELMPVAEFPGERNWGYDGVYPFSVHRAYGGPEGLKRLVNACHEVGLAVILDVVYNHLGPEGNYLSRFGPYFTEKYRTPWGRAINFEGPGSKEVRNYFIENAIHWFREYHLDGLRLDAIHAIYDQSEPHILEELEYQTTQYSLISGRRLFLIAESDDNDPRIIRSREREGYGVHAQWCDDFHHSLHTLLTGERHGYYTDYGTIDHLVKAFREGFVYSGQFSTYRNHPHGSSSIDCPGVQFVVCTQNHDQIGNRLLGERLASLVTLDALKLAAGAMILSPFIPLLFMGEEYAERAPFQYFVSHSDADLIRAVREGRKREFKTFDWTGEPIDPQSEQTFLRSKIDWEGRKYGEGRALYEFYRELLRLRRETPALALLEKNYLEVSGSEAPRLLFLRRWSQGSQIFCLMNFEPRKSVFRVSLPGGSWKMILDSGAKEWGGPGSSLPHAIRTNQELSLGGFGLALYQRE